jgi:nucleotide-binding universal stress UspA family protein
MYTRILAANDGSAGGQKALTAAIELARPISAELHMVTVEELPRFPASIDEVAEEKDEVVREESRGR